MCFQPGHFFQAALWNKLCLEKEFKNFGKDDSNPGPHGGTHDLEIAFVFPKENTPQCLGTQVEQRLGEFDTEKQLERFEIWCGNDLVAIGPLIQIALNDVVWLD